MSCTVQLTKEEYDILEINMRTCNYDVSLFGIRVHVLRLWAERKMPRPDKAEYWLEFRRNLS